MIPHSSLGKEVIVYCTFPGDPAKKKTNIFMSFLPPQIRNSFEYWAALPELVYWAQKKIIITKWSEMVQGKGPEPV